ncbi:CopD family protein [Halocalculus aciditolerans]|nr:CopD family protein [Halocalculus aciditolerans]
MNIPYVLAVVVHLGFAGLWAGGVAFAAWAVLPSALRGDIDPQPLAAITNKLSTLTRVSAVLLLLSGGYMAVFIGGDAFRGTTRGILVGLMVVLWLALTGLSEMACSRLRDGTDLDKVRAPAREAKTRLQAAAVLAVALLVLGGVLATGV